MKAALLYVGARPEPAWEALCALYRTRLQRFVTWQEKRLPLAPGRRHDPKGALAREAKAILQELSGNERMVALDERGREWSTGELAEFLRAHLPLGTLVFVIGSDLGLHPEVLERASVRWSLSRLTLPHQLVRLVVLEQLYRALDLLAGGSYHRAGVAPGV